MKYWGKKFRHKNYYSIYKPKVGGAIYVLEVVYSGGELIYHQTNYTLNSQINSILFLLIVLMVRREIYKGV